MTRDFMPAFPEGKRQTDQPYTRAMTVIVTNFRRGKGETEDDPVRFVTAYYQLDGTLLAEFDEWGENRASAARSAVKPEE